MTSTQPATAAPTAPPLVPTKFAHVVFRTGDLPRLRDWYCTVLNAHAVHDDGTLCFLTFDDEHHRVAIANVPGLEEKSPTSAGVDHVAYTLASVGDLVAHYERLKGQGIEPWWCINHGITLSMYYRDPDGNQVEFQVDRYGPNEREQLDTYFAGPFHDNPIGVNYDPDDLVAKYHGGTAESELLIPGAI